MSFLTKHHLSRRAILRGAGAAVCVPSNSSRLPLGRQHGISRRETVRQPNPYCAAVRI